MFFTKTQPCTIQFVVQCPFFYFKRSWMKHLKMKIKFFSSHWSHFGNWNFNSKSIKLFQVSNFRISQVFFFNRAHPRFKFGYFFLSFSSFLLILKINKPAKIVRLFRNKIKSNWENDDLGVGKRNRAGQTD